MFTKGGSWNRLFSPTLEECIMNASSKDGSFPKSLVTKVEDEVWEAFTMWVNKQHDIFPNMYHHFYEQGETLIYPEHIADIKIIDKIVSNKRIKDAEKERAEAERKQNKGKGGLGGGKSAVAGGKGSGFYGHTFKFNNH